MLDLKALNEALEKKYSIDPFKYVEGVGDTAYLMSEFSDKTGVKSPGLNIIETSLINASILHYKNSKKSPEAILNISNGFLTRATFAEKEWVIGHEYAHRDKLNFKEDQTRNFKTARGLHYYTYLGTAWAVVHQAQAFAGLFKANFEASTFLSSTGNIWDQGMAVVGGVTALTAILTKNHIKQKIEFYCDEKSIGLGSKPEAAISMLKKFQEDSALVEKFLDKKTKFINFIIPEKIRNLFSTHPTNTARIENIEKVFLNKDNQQSQAL